MAPVRTTLQDHPLARVDFDSPNLDHPGQVAPALYVHVPFCRVRCPYCDFATTPYRESMVADFVDGILLEATCVRSLLGNVAFGSLFLGGGTPSRLPEREFVRLLSGLRESFSFTKDPEVSIEVNPEDVEPESLQVWEASGVNRLSLGVQSFQEQELSRLGRQHGAAKAGSAAEQVGAAFPNWSLDLLFAFPGHDRAGWRKSLQAALAFSPPHLSLYQFTAEPGTLLGDAVRQRRLEKTGQEASAEFFDEAELLLEDKGYEHYEISNYARPAHRSIHNLAYWRRAPYLGLGPSAVSQWGRERWRNLPRTERYLEAIEAGSSWIEQRESLEGKELLEIFMLGLRVLEGVAWKDVPESLEGFPAWQRAARKLSQMGWLECDDTGTRIPRAKRGVTDSIVLRLWQEAEPEPGESPS